MTQDPDAVHESVREHYAAQAVAGSCCGPDACCDSSSNKIYPEELLTELPADVTSFSPRLWRSHHPGGPSARSDGPRSRLWRRAGLFPGCPQGRRDGPRDRRRYDARDDRARPGNRPTTQCAERRIPPGISWRTCRSRSGIVDVAISNCVINLAPDKDKVLAEVFRVLKPGAKMAVSDIVTDGPLPDDIKSSLSAWAGCIAGALDIRDYQVRSGPRRVHRYRGYALLLR